jgi:hypothetical protein
MRATFLLLLLLTGCGESAPPPVDSAPIQAPPVMAPAPAALQVEVRTPEHQPLAGVQVRLTEVFQGVAREATSDSEGQARFEALPAGNYELEWLLSDAQRAMLDSSSGSASTLWERIAPRKSVELLAGERLRVTLGGAPAAATHVLGRLTRAGSPAAGVLVIAQALEGERAEFARTLSEHDGSFELRLAQGHYDLTLQHSLGGASLTRRLRVRESTEQHVDIELSGGGLSGRLLDRAGQPVAGRRVELKLLRVQGMPAVDSVRPARISDEDGTFRFRDLPAGTYQLSAGENANPQDPEAPRHARILTRELKLPLPEDKPLDLVLEPGRSLRGLLRGADSGARVMVHDTRGELLAMLVCERDPRLPEGLVEFRVDDLPAGPVRVRAEYRTSASPLLEVARLDEDESTLVELKLEPAIMLRVDIGFQGEVPRCVAVELRSCDGTRVEHRELRAIGSEPASLRAYFTGLLPGRCTLLALDEQGRRAALDHEYTQPGSQTIVLQLR